MKSGPGLDGHWDGVRSPDVGQGVWREEGRKAEVRDEVGKTGPVQMGRAPRLRSGSLVEKADFQEAST